MVCRSIAAFASPSAANNNAELCATQRCDNDGERAIRSSSARCTRVVLIVDDLDTQVANKATGELIRHLTLNPDVDYEPRFKTRETPEPRVRGFPMS